MKSLLAIFALSLLTGVAHADEYVCKMDKAYSGAAMYEDVNDFRFADYPYLIVRLVGETVTSVSVGALEYDIENGEDLQGRLILGYDEREVTVEDTFNGTKQILHIGFSDTLGNALVTWSEEGVLIGVFGECTYDK